MTVLEGTLLVSLIAALCLCWLLFIKLRKKNIIIDALHTNTDFNESKIEELGTRYHSLSKEISKTREKSDYFEHMVDEMPVAIWMRNNENEIKYANKAYMMITGDDEGKKARTVIKIYQDEDKLAQSAHDENTIKTVQQYIIASGQRRLYNITEIPIEEGTIGVAYDINEIDDIKRELEQVEHVQTDLLESSTSAIAIYGSDQHLKYFNQEFVNLWGFTDSYLDGSPSLSDVLERLRSMNKLPEHANFKEFKKFCIDMFTNLIERHEEIYYLPDGRTLRAIAIPAQQGGLIINYKDITYQISLERSYNTLMSVQKDTLDNLTEGIAVFGADGKLQIFNPVYAKLWHLPEEMLQNFPHVSEILDKTKGLYQSKKDWEDFKHILLSLISSRVTTSNRILCKDGATLFWTCSPLPDGGLLLTYTDITDSVRVEQSLRAEQKALREAEIIKNNFLANVSYKLRSPLTSIRGFAEMLLAGYSGKLNASQNEYIKGISASSDQLTVLVDNILDITSIDAGQMVLSVEEFDLYKALKELPLLVADKVAQYNAILVIDCPENIGNMLGERKRIIQIMHNLLRNAFRFIRYGGNIKVRAVAKGKEFIISVEDDGRGIAEDELPYIFERFNKQTANGAGETGLGLTVAKCFIELHGGKVEIESEVDKGTKITCSFIKKNRALLR